MSKLITVIITFLVLLYSCHSGNKRSDIGKPSNKSRITNDSVGFFSGDFGNYRKLTVFDPWQKSAGIKFEYYLVDKQNKVPDELNGKQIIRTPVEKVICLSTTHIGFLDVLGELESIQALSGTGYVSNPLILKAISEKMVLDIGYDQGLNYELILHLKPDLVFAYGVGSEVSSHINKLRDLGINVVLVGEYLEESPLAKAEWIKFIGAFYNKEAEAADFYNQISLNYQTIAAKVADVDKRPFVLTGLPFKESWWMAGGNSNLAKLIRDAGGNFLWSENSSRESFVVSIEDVFMRASKADFWVNCGDVNTMAELLSADPRFSDLPPVKQNVVFNNNLLSNSKGGNDYWESGVVHPDLILSDLVKIFHPEKMSDKPFHYYKKIE
jgi:iron complex transport system substrate-binding protein